MSWWPCEHLPSDPNARPSDAERAEIVAWLRARRQIEMLGRVHSSPVGVVLDRITDAIERVDHKAHATPTIGEQS